MLDYGVKLGDIPQYPIMPDKADALIISHAHLDHSGMAPALYSKSVLPVYGTPLTLKISHILQHDNVKICKLKKTIIPYSEDSIERMAASEVQVDYGVEHKIGDVKFTLHDAGHIPGAATVLLEAEGKRILYTGDINNQDTRLMTGAEVPEADILVSESTYGNRNHPDRKETENQFLDAVDSTIEQKGHTIVPVFAVGRSQEILMLLDKTGHKIYFDGLGRDITRIFLANPEYLRDEHALGSAAENAYWIRNHHDRRKALREDGSVIVSTAGMLQGGPILQYISKLRKDSRSSVLLTGYQVPGTNGRKLVEEGFIVDEKTGKHINVKMSVQQFDFSAHADRDGLKDIAEKVNPEEVFLVHGDPEACEMLAEDLEKDCRVHVPELGDEIHVK